MERKFLFIINPISGRRNRKNPEPVIERVMKAAGLKFTILTSKPDGDYAFLKQQISDDGITDVIIAGGDGTVSAVAGSLASDSLRFGILPFGSGNGLALCAGIPKNTERALNIILKGNTINCDGYYINNRFACMLSGLGFDAQVAHDFARHAGRGLQTYFRETVRNFFAAKCYPFRIEVDGHELETDAFFISVANSNQFGNRFTIAPKASLTDGLLDVVIVTRSNKIGFLLHTLRQVLSYNPLNTDNIFTQKKGVVYFQTSSIHISNLGGAPLHIDGEAVDTIREIDFRISRGHFRLLV